ncbi:dihydrofolate reductase family protein [Nocardioides sp. InS609-2]|uniref:dihydrofolate reductase family protein n=1 Tax=Nocardioides sp. InS609-2 TaxID=2760705 RepID=UPI0020C17527|nr:dihydrofolate reductase family protein [Nocardioides sp. InS609-2]
MSTKVQYYTAATLDGFIADEHHSLDWLFEVPHSDEEEGASSWDTFIAGVGVLTMGATTYEWVLGHHPEMRTSPDRWHEFYGDRPAWVFTHRELPQIPGIDIRFVQGPVRAAYDEMVVAVPDRNIWVVGGGNLVGQFDDAGLLDEIHVHVTPVVLGAGAPLLPRRITSSRLSFREGCLVGQRLNVVLDVKKKEV